MVTNNKKKPGFAVIHLMVLIFPFTFTALLKILRKQLLFIKYFLVLFILSESHHFDMLWLYEPSRHKRPMSLIRK